MKTWPALAIHFASGGFEPQNEARDLLLAALDEARATAIQEFDDRWTVFFATAADRDRAAAALPGSVPGVVRTEAVVVADDDWARRSQRDLTPIRVGRIVVTPPWATGQEPGEGPAGEGAITIVIRPSMGFGTGHHATTRLCLDLLQRLDLAGRTVLDVGTGSGVLALAAHALGARAVVAVDDDPDAIESARENLALNRVAEGIDLRLGDFRGMPQAGAGWDVATANLTGGLLVRGADVLSAAVAPGGALIVSGVTLDEEVGVLAAFAPRMKPVARVVEDEWVGTEFRCRPALEGRRDWRACPPTPGYGGPAIALRAEAGRPALHTVLSHCLLPTAYSLPASRSPHTHCSAVMPTSAAALARSVRLPSVSATQPACSASAVSASVHPPSGPTMSRADFGAGVARNSAMPDGAAAVSPGSVSRKRRSAA